MDTYQIQFYDLMSRALGGNDSKRLQAFLDDVMARKYNTLQLDGFTFEEMQLDFAYEQIQKWDGVMPKVTGGTSGLMINVPLEENNSASQADTSAE